MKEATRYRYDQRIKDLEKRNYETTEKLCRYETSIFEIFDGIVDTNGDVINKNWILKKMRRLIR